MAAHKMEIAQRKKAEGERRMKSEKKVKGQSHPEFVYYAQNGHVDRSKSFELSHWH